MIGNIEGAAECALKCGRTAEALLLALIANSDEVYDRIKDEFLNNHKDPFISHILKQIINED